MCKIHEDQNVFSEKMENLYRMYSVFVRIVMMLMMYISVTHRRGFGVVAVNPLSNVRDLCFVLSNTLSERRLRRRKTLEHAFFPHRILLVEVEVEVEGTHTLDRHSMMIDIGPEC